MTQNSLIQFGVYLAALLLLAKPLGSYMARVYQSEPVLPEKILRPVEKFFYRISSVDEDQEISWKTYAGTMLVFNLLGLLVVYLLQRLQAFLPLNPQSFGGVSPEIAFNTATSFATNTNWQAYGGEMTMSYLVQMLGLTVQNFVSAASGMAVLVAFIRGFKRYSAQTLGNFWVDLTRSVLYILLPLSFVVAVILVLQGVVQTLRPYQPVSFLQPTTDSSSNPVQIQWLALGPAASQVAIKQLGTNGGGFFNVNSAHPFENPTPLSNFVEGLSILLIPAALCYTFGKMVGDTRQGWAVLAAMTMVFVVLLGVGVVAEQNGNPIYSRLGVDQAASELQPGGNMEGKEVRFGIANSALWATATTAASNGSVNSMHDSYTPLGGLAPMWMMQLGEVIYGGVGSGLYGMLVFAIVAVFIAGLMVGRTPEYLGKKIESYEIKMASLVILIPPMLVLGFTALAIAVNAGGFQDSGPHGFSELLYAYSSMSNNNGSAFGGFGASLPFHSIAGGMVMLLARYWLAIPTLAIAGSLVRKKHVPAGPGTLPTHTPLFVMLLIGVVIIVGALTFFPAMALGPIIEHLLIYG